jgi:SAM-dependent methyltransferase
MIYRLKLLLTFLKFLLTHPKSFRYLGKWMKYQFFTKNRDNISTGLPWMNLEIIEWLDKYLKKEMLLFEWGAGGSTIFYAARVNKVISIEYDEAYFGFVQGRLEEKENVELILTPPQETGKLKSFYPEFAGSFFDNYVQTIDAHPDHYFDVIVVDGRQRNACFRSALKKLKPDGIIVFDNFDREIYRKSQYYPDIAFLTFEGLVPFNTALGTTAIFYFTTSGKKISK